MSDFLKLNFGCGEVKLPGFVNIDIEESTKPDIICDIRQTNLPFKDEEVELITCTHNLEHIELKYWPAVFHEFRRVLIPEGILYLAYPEFEVCARYFIENNRGMREFWRATLAGRQLYPGDYHVTPMVTGEVVHWLERYGFKDIQHTPEPMEEWNTFLSAKKGDRPLNREDILRQGVFHKP